MHLTQLRFLCHIGCSEEERSYPQRMDLDAEIGFKLLPGAANGQLEDTIDWHQLQRFISGKITERKWVLVEELGHSLIQSILEQYPLAEEVLLTIRKFPFVHVESVAITLGGKRSSDVHP